MTKVFLSYHGVPDWGRAERIRGLPGLAVDFNTPASEEDWNLIVRSGDRAIQQWIDQSMDKRTCTILLIGRFTRGRRWIDYEVRKSWNEGRAMLALNVHHLLDHENCQTSKGPNPLDDLTLNSGMHLSQVIRTYDPPYEKPELALKYISNGLPRWIDHAFDQKRARAS